MDKSSENGQADNQPLDEETYLVARQGYDQAELEVSGRYDKWILTLSGGALAISITFIEKIAKNPSIETLVWLKLSWFCFVLSLLISLLSLLTSQSAIRENRKELDSSYREGRSPRIKFRRLHTCITNACNWGSLSTFIFGVIFLCVFSFANIDNTIEKGRFNNGRETEKTFDGGNKSNRRLRPIDTTEREKKRRSPTATATSSQE